MRKQLTTVGSNTYETIKNDIIFGRLTPASKLKLNILKKQYSASVSTLRETLKRLASEGFVSSEEQRGFFVTPVSKDDLIEIANLRILIESHALKVSFENGDDEWEGNLVAAHHKLKRMEELMQSGNYSQRETWKQYDGEFHQAMVQACNSKNLLSIHSTIFDKYFRYQMQVLTFRKSTAAIEHKGMLEAALERNVERAQKLLEAHVRGGLEHAMTYFNSAPAKTS